MMQKEFSRDTSAMDQIYSFFEKGYSFALKRDLRISAAKIANLPDDVKEMTTFIKTCLANSLLLVLGSERTLQYSFSLPVTLRFDVYDLGRNQHMLLFAAHVGAMLQRISTNLNLHATCLNRNPSSEYKDVMDSVIARFFSPAQLNHDDYAKPVFKVDEEVNVFLTFLFWRVDDDHEGGGDDLQLIRSIIQHIKEQQRVPLTIIAKIEKDLMGIYSDVHFPTKVLYVYRIQDLIYDYMLHGPGEISVDVGLPWYNTTVSACLFPLLQHLALRMKNMLDLNTKLYFDVYKDIALKLAHKWSRKVEMTNPDGSVNVRIMAQEAAAKIIAKNQPSPPAAAAAVKEKKKLLLGTEPVALL